LAKTLFPLGGFRKSEIRQMAMDRGFHELANKSESYEICFVPDNDYRSFLKNRVPGLEEKLADGKFVNSDGKELGKHKGYPFYTIGQRKGLEVAFGEPMYVTKIDPSTNTVVLGTFEELEKREMWVRDVNLVKYAHVDDGTEVLTKIRYKDPGTPSSISMHDNLMQVVFHKNVNAVAPGQSAVFYEGEDLVGGGFILK
jgi:tRNA-specific 2-thiouridylase